MKIVIFSSTFLPNIGGLENIMAGLAEEWTSMGNEVTVYTITPQTDKQINTAYAIVFKKSNAQLIAAISKADIYLEANISIKNILPGLVHQNKWWVVHHIQYDHQDSKTGLLKQFFARFAKNISVSNFIASKLNSPSTVIHNFVAPSFVEQTVEDRNYDLVFLGRLVSDKGVDRLIETIAASTKKYKCLIIGNGPDKNFLERLSKEKNLSSQIVFADSLHGSALVNALNQSKTMVIPSLWDEPFGVVALEAMACGCTIACSNKKGLHEATGGLAFYFDPLDQSSMLEAIDNAINFQKDDLFINKEKQHLQNHSRSVIAKKYISLFEDTPL
ncbi:MAG: glycosyltransferase family 4 protein [Sphingobacteriia bacterium]|jgi:glycosyltransferase involved in cell wall biosynthesis